MGAIPERVSKKTASYCTTWNRNAPKATAFAMHVDTVMPLIREALSAPCRVMKTALLARRDRRQAKLTGTMMWPAVCGGGSFCCCVDSGVKRVAKGFLMVENV
jgi:hypothetical protein